MGLVPEKYQSSGTVGGPLAMFNTADNAVARLREGDTQI